MTRDKVLTGYVLAVSTLIGGFYFIPSSFWVQTSWQVAIGWASTGAIVVGVRRYRPRPVGAWYLFAAGVFLNSTGILVEQIVIQLAHREVYPTPADGFWLALYPCLAGGLALLMRSRAPGRDWTSAIDASTITTGLGLLCWVFVIRPIAGDVTLDLAGRLVIAAYPVGDVVILAMLVRLAMSGKVGNASLRLLGGAVLTFLLGDVLWMVWKQIGWSPEGHAANLMSMVFLTAFALVGAAALHPAAREVGWQTSPREAKLSPTLLIGLTVASLSAPALLAVQALRGQLVLDDSVAISIGSATVFLLVVTRMAGLLRKVEQQSHKLRDLARVDDLTGLPNRRAWSSELPTAIERARRENHPLSIAMLDLDYFKRYNDNFGHQAGDRLLKGAAAAWRETMRSVDQLARYGGEEFILLLPSADTIEGAAIVERLRASTPAGQTFSAGIATWDGMESPDELIHRADVALYRAKENGRNQTAAAATAAATTANSQI